MDAYINPHDPQNDETAEALGQRLDHLHSLAAAQVFAYMSRTMHSGDVTFSQINALFRLYRHGPQRIADLAEGAHLSHCATSRLVSRLVVDGLVDKRPNPASRRERLVHLTPEGLACLRDIQCKTTTAYASLFRPLPPELTGRLKAVLDEVLPLLPPPELGE